VSDVGTVAVIGGADELEGFALAGAAVHVARTEHDAVAAWHALDDDVALVVLSPDARRSLDGLLAERPDVLTVVTP
jgi:vacuolar-type H+-ATPase subunit F/Vma7